jgi:hypothetical protein
VFAEKVESPGRTFRLLREQPVRGRSLATLPARRSLDARGVLSTRPPAVQRSPGSTIALSISPPLLPLEEPSIRHIRHKPMFIAGCDACDVSGYKYSEKAVSASSLLYPFAFRTVAGLTPNLEASELACADSVPPQRPRVILRSPLAAQVNPLSAHTFPLSLENTERLSRAIQPKWREVGTRFCVAVTKL